MYLCSYLKCIKKFLSSACLTFYNFCSQKVENDAKDPIVARKIQKADREKLRRDRLNEQFLELGKALGKFIFWLVYCNLCSKLASINRYSTFAANDKKSTTNEEQFWSKQLVLMFRLYGNLSSVLFFLWLWVSGSVDFIEKFYYAWIMILFLVRVWIWIEDNFLLYTGCSKNCLISSTQIPGQVLVLLWVNFSWGMKCGNLNLRI